MFPRNTSFNFNTDLVAFQNASIENRYSFVIDSINSVPNDILSIAVSSYTATLVIHEAYLEVYS